MTASIAFTSPRAAPAVGAPARSPRATEAEPLLPAGGASRRRLSLGLRGARAGRDGVGPALLGGSLRRSARRTGVPRPQLGRLARRHLGVGRRARGATLSLLYGGVYGPGEAGDAHPSFSPWWTRSACGGCCGSDGSTTAAASAADGAPGARAPERFTLLATWEARHREALGAGGPRPCKRGERVDLPPHVSPDARPLRARGQVLAARRSRTAGRDSSRPISPSRLVIP